MGLLGDFAAGAGAVGAQMSMDALKSSIEEERATRLAEMQNRFQTARDATISRQRIDEHTANTRTDLDALPERTRITADAEIRKANAAPVTMSEGQTRVVDGKPTVTIAKTANPLDGNTKYSADQHLKGIEMQLGGMQSVQTDAQTGQVVGIGRDGKVIQITNPDGTPLMGAKDLGAAQKKYVEVISDQIKSIDKHIADSMLDPAAKAELERRRTTLNVQMLGALTGNTFVDRFNGDPPGAKPMTRGAPVKPAAPSGSAPSSSNGGRESDRMAILQDELAAEQARSPKDAADAERKAANIASLEREISSAGGKAAPRQGASQAQARPAEKPVAATKPEPTGLLNSSIDDGPRSGKNSLTADQRQDIQVARSLKAGMQTTQGEMRRTKDVDKLNELTKQYSQQAAKLQEYVDKLKPFGIEI